MQDTLLGFGPAPGCAGCGSPRIADVSCTTCGLSGKTAPTVVDGATSPGLEAAKSVLADPTFAERFEILRSVGEGAYSAVFAARDKQNSRDVALKLLLDPTPTDVARAQREGSILSRLDHPNIVRLHGVDAVAGTIALSLELIEGKSLASQLAVEGRFSPEKSIRTMQMLLAGLSAGHAAGIVHRDVKPENVLVRPDSSVKLLDFGLARDAGATGALAQLTKTGVMLGTPAYLSPELIQGQKATPAADIYSAGVVLHQLLAGQVPFTGDNLIDIISQHLTKAPPSLRELRPDVPAQLAEIAARAMAKHVSERYVTAQMMHDDLGKVLASLRPAPMKVRSGRGGVAASSPTPTIESDPAVGGVQQPPAAVKLPAFSASFRADYEYVRPLGQGGMGVVYLMRQVKLDRLVAVKVVRPETFTQEERQRLLREARALASLNHAAVLGIHDVGIDGDLPYMICEYVEGETLRSRLGGKTPLSLISTIRLTLQILDGLHAAHRAGIVHRDLKPDNILLTREGKPKIADFGLARSQKAPPGASINKIAGTPAYMSPEQARGQETNAASDLYSVGVILFQMSVGALPFPGPEVIDYLVQHTTQPAPPARSMKPDIPSALERILARALEKEPAKRFSSAAEFMKALLDLYKGMTSGATPTPAGKQPRAASASNLSAGVKLAERYELVRVVGQGGMGQVWLAKDTALDGSSVAVKLLPAELWNDAQAKSTVIQEAKLSLKLSHPNILRIVNLEPGNPPFLVMEFLEATTLADELSRRKLVGEGPFSVQEALPLIEALAGALDHAHALDILHRDVKPSNILLVPAGTGFIPKLADFGIAAEIKKLKSGKSSDAPTGTLNYMSPEQLASEQLDLRADVFSLAATVCQMLTLEAPGGDEAPLPGVPKYVAEIVRRGLARNRDARPGTAGSFARDLKMASLRHEMLTTSGEMQPVVSADVPTDRRPVASTSGAHVVPVAVTHVPVAPPVAERPWPTIATSVNLVLGALALIIADGATPGFQAGGGVLLLLLVVPVWIGHAVTRQVLVGGLAVGLSGLAVGTVSLAVTSSRPGRQLAVLLGLLAALATRTAVAAGMLARPSVKAFCGEEPGGTRPENAIVVGVVVGIVLTVLDVALAGWATQVLPALPRLLATLRASGGGA